MANGYIVVVAGSAIDEYYNIETWLNAGDSCLAKPLGQKIGGCILNVGAVAAGLGMDVKVMDYLKKDDIDTYTLLKGMKDYNLDTEYILQDKDVTNCKCLIMQCASEKCIYVIEPSRPNYDMSDGKLQSLLNGAEYIYGLMHNMHIAFGKGCTPLKIAKSHGAKIIFDGASQYSDPAELETVKLADALVMNDMAYARLSEKFSKPAKDAMFSFGTKYVCETLGEKGAFIHTPTHSSFSPSIKVNVVDSTGAGDTFTAAFIYGLYRSWPTEKTVRFATAAGARACTVYGGFGGVASEHQIVTFATENGIKL
ncbi:Bifunctional ribokinase/ribose-5-phosphate isomerase A [bioreactor metagenome]|uniref:Bifunctional ribokinase/ribose-5-phosphate isomerase A n=1 Tax=bioreactor metagenome TaxID=1076179 RepID=A0A645B1D2_9ZZZZ|nr:carbohydrate kinase family protein [Candidatus Metalachnospira sp.]